jgi:hypothetical protein
LPFREGNGKEGAKIADLDAFSFLKAVTQVLDQVRNCLLYIFSGEFRLPCNELYQFTSCHVESLATFMLFYNPKSVFDQLWRAIGNMGKVIALYRTTRVLFCLWLLESVIDSEERNNP